MSDPVDPVQPGQYPDEYLRPPPDAIAFAQDIENEITPGTPQWQEYLKWVNRPFAERKTPRELRDGCILAGLYARTVLGQRGRKRPTDEFSVFCWEAVTNDPCVWAVVLNHKGAYRAALVRIPEDTPVTSSAPRVYGDALTHIRWLGSPTLNNDTARRHAQKYVDKSSKT